MSLQEIGLKHGTDKATYHMYMDVYEKHIDRENTKRFLEIGVQRGFSIKAWLEWFPEGTIIEGWDVENIPEIEGADLRWVNQLNKTKMIENITGMYDVILDDGGHTSEMMEVSIATLFPHCKMYIIEDLHAPWTGPGYVMPRQISTFELIEKFELNGWTSKYCTETQRSYLNNNIEIVEFFVRGPRSRPLSSTVVIKNKENNV